MGLWVEGLGLRVWRIGFGANTSRAEPETSANPPPSGPGLQTLMAPSSATPAAPTVGSVDVTRFERAVKTAD